jgi:iron complex outermembrane receptor protein
VTPTPVAPEVLDAYEVGLKSDLLEHRVRLNVAAFYYDYSQIQVSVSNRTSVILMNGAGAHIYGVDVDFEAKLAEGLTLNAGAEALHDEFTSFQGATFFVPQTAAQGGGNLLVAADAAGKQLPNTPRYTFNIGLNYVVPVHYGDLHFNITYAYMGSWFQGPDNILKSPPSNLVNSMVALRLPDRKTEVSVWVKNLTNQDVPMFLQAASNAGGYSEQVNQPPRTFGFTVQHDF